MAPQAQQGRKTLVAGSWGHVPPGCSAQTKGDWAAHYNHNTNGNNDGHYTLLCSTGPQGEAQGVQDSLD